MVIHELKLTEIKIPLTHVEGESDSFGKAKIIAGQSVFYVKENILSPAEPGYPSPLEAFLSGLVGCEIIMFQMFASQLDLLGKFNMKVEADGEFEMGEGLKKLNIKYIFRGLSLDEARALLEMVKQSCPVYSTIKKSGVVIEESLAVE
jgi:uncharacterized OsmC-like protein